MVGLGNGRQWYKKKNPRPEFFHKSTHWIGGSISEAARVGRLVACCTKMQTKSFNETQMITRSQARKSDPKPEHGPSEYSEWNERLCTNGLLLRDLPSHLRDYRHLITAALQQNGLALQFASEHEKDDSFLVLTAAKQNSEALEYASERMQQQITPERIAAFPFGCNN